MNFFLKAAPSVSHTGELDIFIDGLTTFEIDALITETVQHLSAVRFEYPEDTLNGRLYDPALIPELVRMDGEDSDSFRAWADAIASAEASFNALFDAGIPKEDAALVLPLNTAKRVIITLPRKSVLPLQWSTNESIRNIFAALKHQLHA